MNGKEIRAFAESVLSQPWLFNPDARHEIEGIASTGKRDSNGMARDPAGARLENPVPLLYSHRHDSPVGWAELRVIGEAIHFKAVLANVGILGVVEIWDRLRTGEIGCCSIGAEMQTRVSEYRPGDIEHWELVELSLCEEGANPDAVITRVCEKWTRPGVIRVDGRPSGVVHRDVRSRFPHLAPPARPVIRLWP